MLYQLHNRLAMDTRAAFWSNPYMQWALAGVLWRQGLSPAKAYTVVPEWYGRSRMPSPQLWVPMAVAPGVAHLFRPATAGAAPEPADAPAQLVAWWPFKGDTRAAVGEHIDGTSVDGWGVSCLPLPAEAPFGQFGCNYNGTSYVEVPNSYLWNFSDTDFSITLWVNFSSPLLPEWLDTRFIGSWQGGFAGKGWYFGLDRGQKNLVFYVQEYLPDRHFEKYLASTRFSREPDRWHHLAVTRKDFVYTIYVDGKVGTSEIFREHIPKVFAPLTIGQVDKLGFMKGRIANVKIYSGALSPKEIQGLFASGR